MSEELISRDSKQQQPTHLGHELEKWLALADIQVGGDRPWDIRLKTPRVLEQAMSRGNLGLGEAYLDGDWEVDRLDEFFYRLLLARLDEKVVHSGLFWQLVRCRFMNLQTLQRAWQVGEAHYDLGNEFYAAMLDSRLTYTCGYWQEADSLEAAQEAKLDMICRKLGLEPGMKLLDIGCGWGSFMSYAAEHYGVEATGVTVSREQAAWAAERYQQLPLKFLLQDYRQVEGQYDRIVSIGMFEHVGRKNMQTFMEVARSCLKPEGLMLLHTIGKNKRANTPDPWLDKYIFPNGDLPSIGQIGDAADGNFVVEDLHNFGADYDKTLLAWDINFTRAWPEIAPKLKLDERFYRMWRYYLLSCAGAFRARRVQVWQWVLSPQGVPGGYQRLQG
ncbi:cyclopropane-fatty-acyl-phospholipid synthase [Marinospirillum celere]|uniref:Cyclopropane-fatty-acyl-phospholipid synthase n=1 Tax=Marinospirillum celere TaxID=1122252 RepID=A0A1I1HJN2_9GAMM|nr:cyclopropane fatty acyl phospholipid synthase [Marinospirillum celere]SFC21663.1 cyclopropane-fatty-acyl-phospholipid synthase [Marinospirillum celere]